MDYTGVFDDFVLRPLLICTSIQSKDQVDDGSLFPARRSSKKARRRIIWTVKAMFMRLETIVGGLKPQSRRTFDQFKNTTASCQDLIMPFHDVAAGG